MIDEKDKDLYESYLKETREMLENVRAWLTGVGAGAPPRWEDPRRWAHTISGSAGLFGFNELRRLAKTMELYFAGLGITQGVPTPDRLGLINEFYESVQLFLRSQQDGAVAWPSPDGLVNRVLAVTPREGSS